MVNALRGRMDAAEYKQVVLGLILLKTSSGRRPKRAGRILEHTRTRLTEGKPYLAR